MSYASLAHFMFGPPCAPSSDDYESLRREYEEAMREFAQCSDAYVAVPRDMLEQLAELSGGASWAE